ncbi:MAG: ATP-binding protein, partial [Pseudomonadota bacterium]
MVSSGWERTALFGNAICTMLGYEEELVGQHVAKIFPKEQIFEDTRLAKFIKDGSVRNYDETFLTKKGEQISVSFSGSVMRDHDGNLEGFLGIARDMREIRWFIRKLEDKAQELEKSNEDLKKATVQLIQSEKLSALGELTAGVTHELNQPLNGIKIISQSILRDIEKNQLEEEDIGDDLTEIVGQVNKMAEIIDHMRIYTRQTEGDSEEMVDINKVIEGPLKLLNQQLKNHNIDLVMELTPDLPKIMGDPIRLEQVFMNLINNARNALESCGRENKRIEIRSYKTDNQGSATGNHAVAVEVMDNGDGVPEHLREKIFQPFFTTRESGKGTGLGLSVSSKIIEEHRG